MVRKLASIGILAAMVASQATAQDQGRKYVVGIRSAVITGTMGLSGVDPAFDDLSFDGLEGPHMSGFFFMYKVRPHVRIGVETLVANSTPDVLTTMNYQAAGPVLELSYGATWFVSGGVHAGGLIVNAMARQGTPTPEGASVGQYYKGDGAFLAPYADVGRRFGRGEVSLFVKQVNIFGEKERGGMSDFSSKFVGVRFGVGL